MPLRESQPPRIPSPYPQSLPSRIASSAASLARDALPLSNPYAATADLVGSSAAAGGAQKGGSSSSSGTVISGTVSAEAEDVRQRGRDVSSVPAPQGFREHGTAAGTADAAFDTWGGTFTPVANTSTLREWDDSNGSSPPPFDPSDPSLDEAWLYASRVHVPAAAPRVEARPSASQDVVNATRADGAAVLALLSSPTFTSDEAAVFRADDDAAPQEVSANDLFGEDAATTTTNTGLHAQHALDALLASLSSPADTQTQTQTQTQRDLLYSAWDAALRDYTRHVWGAGLDVEGEKQKDRARQALRDVVQAETQGDQVLRARALGRLRMILLHVAPGE